MSTFLKKIALYGSLAVLAGVRLAAINVTIQDPHDDAKVGTDTNAGLGNPEDGYTEYGHAVSTHDYDLQSFDASGTIAAASLKMTGGINYASGVPYSFGSGGTYEMGDIFVYINKKPYTVGNSNPTVAGGQTFTGQGNWDFVIHFDRNASDNYNIVAGKVQYEILTPGQVTSTVNTGEGQPILTGLPLRVTTGVATWKNADYHSSGSGPTFENDVSGIDVTPIVALLVGNGFVAYLDSTMSCGNDVLWGGPTASTFSIIPTTDGGITLAMLGGGLLGLALMQRRLT